MDVSQGIAALLQCGALLLIREQGVRPRCMFAIPPQGRLQGQGPPSLSGGELLSIYSEPKIALLPAGVEPCYGRVALWFTTLLLVGGQIHGAHCV